MVGSDGGRQRKVEALEIEPSHPFSSAVEVPAGSIALMPFRAEFELPSKPSYPCHGYGFCWGTTLATRTRTLGKPVAVPARVAVPMPFPTPK
jgi:hypothetical protein